MVFRLRMRHHVFPAKVPPPVRSGNRVVRGYYTRSQLSEAVKQALLGKMSVTQAAIHYKIPRTTVQKHVSLARKEHQRAIEYRVQNQVIRRGLCGLVQTGDLKKEVAAHEMEYIETARHNRISCMEFTSEVLWYKQPVRFKDQDQSMTMGAESTLNYSTSELGNNNSSFCGLEMDVAVECEISTEPSTIPKNAVSNSFNENLDENTMLKGVANLDKFPIEHKESSTPQQFIDVNPNKLTETSIRRIMIRNEQTGAIVREVILRPASVVMFPPTIVKSELDHHAYDTESSNFKSIYPPGVNQSCTLNENINIDDESSVFMEPII